MEGFGGDCHSEKQCLGEGGVAGRYCDGFERVFFFFHCIHIYPRVLGFGFTSFLTQKKKSFIEGFAIDVIACECNSSGSELEGH